MEGPFELRLDAQGQRIWQALDVAISSGPAAPTTMSVTAPTGSTSASSIASERKRCRSKSGRCSHSSRSKSSQHVSRSESGQRSSRLKRSRHSHLSSCSSISCGSKSEKQDHLEAIFEERARKAAMRMQGESYSPEYGALGQGICQAVKQKVVAGECSP